MNGNVVQKNHPTVGSIPSGATVEVGVATQVLDPAQKVTFVLADADYTTATRIAEAINGAMGPGIADARDASAVEINERTGTVVSGGDVRISPVAISHGDLKVSIVTVNTASQPAFIAGINPGVNTAIVSNTRINVEEKGETGLVTASNNTVADLVQALTRIKTNTRDIISILRAVKAAGALYADLIIQ